MTRQMTHTETNALRLAFEDGATFSQASQGLHADRAAALWGEWIAECKANGWLLCRGD